VDTPLASRRCCICWIGCTVFCAGADAEQYKQRRYQRKYFFHISSLKPKDGVKYNVGKAGIAERVKKAVEQA
jgi:hypothetical protein